MPRLMQKIATEDHAPIRSVRPSFLKASNRSSNRVLSQIADDRYATCAELALRCAPALNSSAPPKPAQAEHEWLLP